MSGILDHSSSSGPSTGLSQGDALAIAGAAAFVIILVSSTIGWGLWIAYRTTKILSTATKTPIAQRVSQSNVSTFVSEMSTIEMGTSLLKGDTGNNWEQSQPPYLRAQTSELSMSLPTLPERAYAFGLAPFPPSLPRCQTLDAVRSPIMVPHSATDLCGVEVVLGTSNNATHQTKESQNPPFPQPTLVNFDEEHNEQRVSVPAPYYAGLGLTLIDIDAATDDLTVQIEGDAAQDTPPQAEVNLLDSTSEMKLSNHLSLDPVPAPLQLPTPLVTPILPTLVLTSAPFKRSADINTKLEQSDCASQLASPPETPTLFLTAPSIHCGLGSSVEGMTDCDEELESWSDVLGFQEYEDDETLLDRASCRLLEEFPTPPRFPAQCSILNVPRFASTVHDVSSGSSVPNSSVTTLQATNDKQDADKVEDNVEQAPFDYAAFRERLAIFLKDVDEQKICPTVTIKDTSMSPSVKNGLRTSASATQFDYGKLRARKRSHTLVSSTPSPQATPMRIGPRPLPLPVEFPPLLSRAIDRPRRQASP